MELTSDPLATSPPRSGPESSPEGLDNAVYTWAPHPAAGTHGGQQGLHVLVRIGDGGQVDQVPVQDLLVPAGEGVAEGRGVRGQAAQCSAVQDWGGRPPTWWPRGSGYRVCSENGGGRVRGRWGPGDTGGAARARASSGGPGTELTGYPAPAEALSARPWGHTRSHLEELAVPWCG